MEFETILLLAILGIGTLLLNKKVIKSDWSSTKDSKAVKKRV